MTSFSNHDRDRESLARAIADLHSASVFGPAPLKVKDLDAAVRPWAELVEEAGFRQRFVFGVFVRTRSKLCPRSIGWAVGYKGLFYFLRAFQDVAYAMLLELEGQKAGSGTSMNKCFEPVKGGKPSNNPIRALILSKIPGYESWFARFRELRNNFKRGRGNGLATQDGQVRVGIDFQQGNVSRRETTIGIPEITEAIQMSAALFRLMKEVVQVKGGAS
jgi:hypothetical protein